MRFDACKENTYQISQVTKNLYWLLVLNDTRRVAELFLHTACAFWTQICIQHNIVQTLGQTSRRFDQTSEVNIRIAATLASRAVKDLGCLTFGLLIDQLELEKVLHQVEVELGEHEADLELVLGRLHLLQLLLLLGL